MTNDIPRDATALSDPPALSMDMVRASTDTDETDGGVADSPRGATPEVSREVPDMPPLVVVIPARGGSKGVVGKNIRPVGGIPLIHHAIEQVLALKTQRIIVSTDSETVVGVVETGDYGVEIDWTFGHSDTTTVDELTEWYHQLYPEAMLVVVQPTTFGNYVHAIIKTMREALKEPGWYTITQPAKGTYWEIAQWGEGVQLNNSSRLNRQQASHIQQEVGIRVVYGTSPMEYWWPAPYASDLIDIDTVGDFAAAETVLHKDVSIGIIYKSGPGMGWGHKKRACAISHALQDYNVSIYEQSLASLVPFHPDIWIHDVGDTNEYEMSVLRDRGSMVIAIEDNGPGTRLADISINPFNDPKYAVLRPEFYNLPEFEVRDKVERVFLTFGGQDNHGTLDRVSTALFTVVDFNLPITDHMAADMLKADILICAGGTTVLEAMKVGIPTIVIPSLPTEAMRPHLDAKYGILNLGMAPSPETIQAAYFRLAEDKRLRQDMSNRMKATRVGDGIVEIRRLIEDLCSR